MRLLFWRPRSKKQMVKWFMGKLSKHNVKQQREIVDEIVKLVFPGHHVHKNPSKKV